MYIMVIYICSCRGVMGERDVRGSECNKKGCMMEKRMDDGL